MLDTWPSSTTPVRLRPLVRRGNLRCGRRSSALASLIRTFGLLSVGLLLGVLLTQPCTWQHLQTRGTAALLWLGSQVSGSAFAAPFVGLHAPLDHREARSDPTDYDDARNAGLDAPRRTPADRRFSDIADGCHSMSAPFSGDDDPSASFAGTLMRMRLRCPP